MNVSPSAKTLVYRLTSEDLALADRLAHLRNDPKLHYRNPKWFPGKRTTLEAHQAGARGEVGAARALGLVVDNSESPLGDAGVDMTLPTGLTVEIRYRTQRGWDFALNGPDVSFLKSDIGILVWPGEIPNSIELMGWTTRVHMVKKAESMNFGYGDRMVLPHSKLLGMNQLPHRIPE